MNTQKIEQDTQAQVANTIGSLVLENASLAAANRYLEQKNTALTERLNAMEQDK
jgi:hypothetical protein